MLKVTMNEQTILIIAVIIILLLVFQRWFWLLVFGIGGLASLFAMIASIIHFQILGALGFFALMIVCLGFFGALSE
ncbi:hypothetical protein D8Y20_07020 [Mariprofundus sp. EBB-1]|nr:hypothetical protein D8Y20_07020 [Mariprofundus sp. EBB-1]